ncbi:hypothetical protein ACFLUS_00455 [Chloroflexota bacterium]
MVATWLQVFVAVLTVFAFLFCLAVTTFTIYLMCFWRKYPKKDDTRRMIISMQKDIDKIRHALEVVKDVPKND